MLHGQSINQNRDAIQKRKARTYDRTQETCCCTSCSFSVMSLQSKDFTGDRPRPPNPTHCFSVVSQCTFSAATCQPIDRTGAIFLSRLFQSSQRTNYNLCTYYSAQGTLSTARTQAWAASRRSNTATMVNCSNGCDTGLITARAEVLVKGVQSLEGDSGRRCLRILTYPRLKRLLHGRLQLCAHHFAIEHRTGTVPFMHEMSR